MLWHLRAEILGWKEKIDSLLKKVDRGLSLIMGLGQDFVACKDCKDYVSYYGLRPARCWLRGMGLQPRKG